MSQFQLNPIQQYAHMSTFIGFEFEFEKIVEFACYH